MGNKNQSNVDQENPKIYTRNMQIFEDASKSMIERLGSTKNIVLDLGNDKRAQFAMYLAGKYEDSLIVNFRDIKTFISSEKKYKRRNLIYVEEERELAKWDFNLATAFLSFHEYFETWRAPTLETLYKNLSPGGLGFVLDYELEWVGEENIDDNGFIGEIFTERNERKVMKKEDDGKKRHTSYGSRKCIADLTAAGFKNISTKQYFIDTSYGVQPKFFSCVGEKVN